MDFRSDAKIFWKFFDSIVFKKLLLAYDKEPEGTENGYCVRVCKENNNFLTMDGSIAVKNLTILVNKYF